MKKTCLICSSGEYPICERCYDELEFVKYPRKLTYIDSIKILMPYAKIPKKFMIDLKFNHNYGYIDFFYAIIQKECDFSNIDYLIYIPDDIFRRMKRGTNVSHEIVKRISNDYHIPIAKVLKRKGISKPSHEMTGYERANKNHNFYIKGEIENANYLVVDDILTTGKTLSDVGKTIKMTNEMGRVNALVILGEGGAI